MKPFSQLTPAMQRTLLAGYAGQPVRLYTKNDDRLDLIVQSIAQNQRTEADPYSAQGSLLVARYYTTPTVLILRIRDIDTIEPLKLSPTDPNHPDYEPEAQVVTPIPVEAMAARKRREATRHDQL